MDLFILKLSTERWNLWIESYRLNQLILIYLYYSWLHLYKEKRGTGQRPNRLNQCQKSILYAFFFPFSSRLFLFFPELLIWQGEASISPFLWKSDVTSLLQAHTPPQNSKVQKHVSERHEVRIIGNYRSYRPRMWVIQTKNVICLHHIVWKEQLAIGLLFLHCHSLQSVGPETNQLVI